MNVHVRRASLAALLSITTLLPAAPTFAACSISASVCVDDLLPTQVGGGGGDGVICTYVKAQYPPPSDWQNEDYDEAPYVFQRTQAWGNTYEHRKGFDWDVRDCLILACVTLDTPVVFEEVCPSTES